MATSKVTITTDEIHPKTPNALRVVFTKNAGNKVGVALTAIDPNDYITRQQFNDNVPSPNFAPFIYNLPAGSQTPIIIDFNNNTIKIGAASPVAIGVNLTNYKENPGIRFEVITSAANTSPKPTDPWITNKQWFDITYVLLVSVTLQPDTDTGLPGGLTLDNINIIIKP